MSDVEVRLPVYSGASIDLLNPKPEDIHLIDIVQSLSKMPRYLGHTKRLYSVAEHSVRMYVAARVLYGTDLAWEALLHDAAEAYVCDLPTMIKRNIVGFSDMEERIMVAVRIKFGLPPCQSPEVSRMDKAIRRLEVNESLFIRPETLRGNGVDNGQVELANDMEEAMNGVLGNDGRQWGWFWQVAMYRFAQIYMEHGWEGTE